MEDHIPIRPDRSLVLGTQSSKVSLWDVVFHENNSINVYRTKYFESYIMMHFLG